MFIKNHVTQTTMTQDLLQELLSPGGVATLVGAVAGLTLSAYCHNHIVTIARVAGRTGINPTQLNKIRARTIDSTLQTWSTYMPGLRHMQSRAELSAILDRLRGTLPSEVQEAFDKTLCPYELLLPSIEDDSVSALRMRRTDLQERVNRFYAAPAVRAYLLK